MRDIDRFLQTTNAIIFDCDGTLVDTPRLYAPAWQDAFGSIGIDMPLAWYHSRAGMSEDVLMDDFEHDHGVRLDRAQVVRAMRGAFLARVANVEEIAPIANIARRHHGTLPMAVASGGPAGLVAASLRHAGLVDLFAAVVTIDDVAHPKPAPDLFHEAARRLGVDPGDCLVFEDSPKGLIAARRAGMQVIDVRSLLEPAKL
ncbi:MAG: HAD family phosphatase [Roseibium sp.]|nr:HAD family phosphatase [Roseibium sp.]